MVRRGSDGFGTGQKIGLVGLEKIDDGGQHGGFVRPRFQICGIKPGERNQPICPAVILQCPHQRMERKRHGIIIVDCLGLAHRLSGFHH